MKNLYNILLLTFGFGQDYSIHFDYMSGYAESVLSAQQTFDNNESFTVEVWYKNDGVDSGNNVGYDDQAMIVGSYNRAPGDPYNNFNLKIYSPIESNAGKAYADHSTMSTNRIDDGLWHHIAATYTANGSNSYSISIYIDGQLNDTNIGQAEWDHISSNNKIRINNHSPSAGDHMLDCYIAGLKISSGIEYASSFNPVFPFTNNENTLVNLDFSNGSSSALDNLSNSSNNFNLHGSYQWVADVPTYLILGCMDELAENYDDTANVDDGSCTYPDNGDYSLSFDGVDDYVQLGTLTWANFSSGTISGSFIADDVSGGGMNNNIYLIGESTSGLAIRVGYGEIWATINDINNCILEGPDLAVEANREYQFLMTWDSTSTSLAFYLLSNNIIQSLSTNSCASGTPNNPSSDFLGNGWDGKNWNGGISNISVWDEYFAPTTAENFLINNELAGYENQLKAKYGFSVGSGDILYDHSGNGNHGTINGATWVENIYGCTDELACNYNPEANWDDDSCDFTCHDNGDYSLSFDGENDYVDLNQHFLLSNNFSIEIKFNPNSEGFYNYVCDSGAQLFMNGGGGGSGIYPDIGIGISDFMSETPEYNGTCIQLGNKVIAVEFGSSSGTYRYYSQEPVILDDMNHIILTFSSGDVKVYLNGEIAIEQSIPISNLNNNSASNATLSARNVSESYLSHIKGRYSYFSIYNKVLTDEDINNILQNNYENLSDNYITLYKFNAGEGTTLYDHSGNGNHGVLMNMDESSWVENIYGCTDSYAENYNSDANWDEMAAVNILIMEIIA